MSARRSGATPARGSSSLSPPARPPFPGIASPYCHPCSWAWHPAHQRMEVKYVNRLCAIHSRALEVAHAS